MTYLRSFWTWLQQPIGRKTNRTWRLRRIVQLGFALTCVFIGWQLVRFYQAAQAGQTPLPVRPPGVEGFLPISGLMGLKDWWLQGALNGIHPAATILVVIFLAMAFFLRKAFCSWICPVGLVSESLAWIGRRIYGRNFRPWRPVDFVLRGLKYLLLGFFLNAIYHMNGFALQQFIHSNYNYVADIKMGLFFVELGGVGLVVMILLVVLSTFTNGAWCRYLCPYGALLGAVSWLSPSRIQRDPVSCIDCRKCDQVCMAQLPVSRKVNVLSPECTGCLDCVAACPVEDALSLKTTKKKIPMPVFAAAVLLVFFGGYISARSFGLWQNRVSDIEYIHHMQHMEGPGYGHPGGSR